MIDGGLLERIAAAAGYEYFSDIKHSRNTQRVLAVAADILPEEYPLEIWSYALSYIMERTLRFENTDELKAFLKEGWINGVE